MEKKVIVLGGVANYDRKNRDSGRVLFGGGYSVHACGAHLHRTTKGT